MFSRQVKEGGDGGCWWLGIWTCDFCDGSGSCVICCGMRLRIGEMKCMRYKLSVDDELRSAAVLVIV